MSDPMTEERLANLREWAEACIALSDRGRQRIGREVLDVINDNDRLRAENERLTAALVKLGHASACTDERECFDTGMAWGGGHDINCPVRIAYDALNPEPRS